MKPFNFRLKIEHLWGLTALVGIFVFVNTHPIRPQDFWWHIAIGREIATTGKIPAVDVYSYIEAGQPYPSYQMFWLMDTGLYELYHAGGAALVVFIHSLLVTAAYGVVFLLCLKVSHSWRIAAFGVLFAAALGINDWNVRPQDITFLLASLFLLAIYQYRQEHRWSWLLIFPISMLVWVNSHGTFIIGLALLALWWGQELWEALIKRVNGTRGFPIKPVVVPGVVLVITALLCLVNPRGFGIVNYIKTLTGSSVVQNLVTEWAAPSLSTSMGVLFFSCLLGCAVLLAISPKRPNFYQITALVVFGLLSIKTSRGIVWFGLVLAAIVAEHIAALVARYRVSQPKTTRSEGSRVANVVFVSVIALMGLVSLPWFKNYLPLPAAKAGLISSETPVQATRVLLEQNPPGKLFNSMSFGSYLIWAAYPQYQVFVDTRIELYPEKIWLDYLNISNASGDWETSLENYGVNTLMLSPDEQAGLIQAALASGEWILLYQDAVGVVFERK